MLTFGLHYKSDGGGVTKDVRSVAEGQWDLITYRK